MISTLKRVEASLTIGSAAEPDIRSVMLNDVRRALSQAPEVLGKLKDLEKMVRAGDLQAVSKAASQIRFLLEPEFAHCVGGRWYFSTDIINPPDTLDDYRDRIKAAYGDLKGVKFATRGIDYDEMTLGRPVKNGHYL